MNFTFTTAKTIVNEPGAASRLAEFCEPYRPLSVLLITDRSIKQLGLLDEARSSLKKAKITVTVFDRVVEDPHEAVVLGAVNLAKQCNANIIVGFGGGSSMDVAKLVALLASPRCDQELADVYGVGSARGQRLPLIQVPTTAGTGSEVTPVSIITTGETTKMGAVSPLFLPDMALLDAELTVGLPPHVTAATGIDAMVHAVEAYTSKLRKNRYSDMLACQALRLLSANIQTAVENGSDIAAREGMLFGAMLAGQAFANAPVAAVHALAYPLGGHFHIPHGLSNSLVLPEVLKFNAANSNAQQQYAELASVVLGDKLQAGDDAAKAAQLIEYFAGLAPSLGLESRLREMDIKEDMLPKLASDAMLQQRLLVNNPRDVTEADALAIYQAAY